MARSAGNLTKRPRISIDIDPDFRRRVRVAAAQHEMSVREFILNALEAQLTDDAGPEKGSRKLTAFTDPLLAKLWDNPLDAEYDQLYPR